MKNDYKYVILYGSRYVEELYSFASNLTEAKQHIEDCISETGCDHDEIICLEVKNRNVSVKLKVSVK